MNRDWRTFWYHAFRSVRYLIVGLALIPVYSLMLNPTDAQIIDKIGSHLVVGLEICIIYWCIMTGLYATIYIYPGPESLLKHKTSTLRQAGVGVSSLGLSMALTNFINSWSRGQELQWAGLSGAFLIGAVTYLLTTYIIAYRRTREHNLQLQAQSAESQLHVLKNQMQPHFLFNSLNSLSELIDSKHPQAALMTQKLADLYRQILLASAEPLNSVAREFDIVQAYLDLERLRFGERLKFRLERSPEDHNFKVPSLMLQTLVENGIKHGVSQTLEAGEIVARAQRVGPHLQVEVINTCTADPHYGNGFGLANTKSRLDLVYQDKHEFKFDIENGQARVKFFVPERAFA